MSRENVELIRKVFQAFSVGDRAQALSYADEAIVVDATRRVFNPTTYRGTQGLRQMLSDMDDVWAELRPEAFEFVDAGDRVLVSGRMSGMGKSSGVTVGREFAGIWTVRGGRVVRWDLYPGRAEALEAAGLSE